MCFTSATMQHLDCAPLYNHKAEYRKQNLFAQQTVISIATTHSHVQTHLMDHLRELRYYILNITCWVSNPIAYPKVGDVIK
jgi:hypothetical protein